MSSVLIDKDEIKVTVSSSLQESIITVRDELLRQEDFYKGFLASIESAIQEKEESSEQWHNDIFFDTDDWAKAILDRIIGLE